MIKKLRFAPSPTGFLHLGNARTALLCYLLTKKHQGQLILRIDDTDQERCKEEFTQQLLNDLKWLNLHHDAIYYQSQRHDIYQSIMDNLKKQGILYPCYETKEELELKRKLQLKNKLPPIYDRECLKIENLPQEKKSLYLTRKPHWRFKLDHSQEISWFDHAKQHAINFKPQNISDPIVIRENDIPTYLLISVIDDIAMQITDVIRGEDHISNTAIQIQMFEILNANIPNFYHLPLIKHEEQKISKRVGGLEIKNLNNLESMTINNYLFNLGQSKNFLYQNLSEMAENFQITNFSSSAPMLNLQDLNNLNAEVLRNMTYLDLQKKINITEQLWELIKNNIKYFDDIYKWQAIFADDWENNLNFNDTQQKIIQHAMKNLAQNLNFAEWVEQIHKTTNQLSIKKKDIILSIRLALTGCQSGPKLPDIYQFLGIENIKKRLVDLKF